jgi:hypothetical protein
MEEQMLNLESVKQIDMPVLVKMAKHFAERDDTLSLDCLRFSLSNFVYNIEYSETMRQRWRFFNKCRKYETVILYGAGNEGRVTLEELEKRGVKVTAFIDRNKQGDIFGIPVISLDEYKEKFSAIPVIITPAFHKKEIRGFLDQNGINNYFSFLDNTVLLDETDPRLIPQAARLFKESGVPQYFSLPELPHIKDEVFVDCGVYDGNTIKDFISWCNNGGGGGGGKQKQNCILTKTHKLKIINPKT